MKTFRKLCVICNSKRAIFIKGGRARFRRDHDLCPKCYRSLLTSALCKWLNSSEWIKYPLQRGIIISTP